VFVAFFSFDNNGGDALLLKFDAAGTLLWERTWGGSESDSANAVATAADGSVYITGRETSFGAGLFVVKFDGEGNLLWQKITNAAGGDAIAVGADGSVYAAGSIIRDNNLANFDILVVKLTSAGAEVWRRTYSAGEVVDARGRMAAAPDGSIVLAGAIRDAEGEHPRYRPADRQARSGRQPGFQPGLWRRRHRGGGRDCARRRIDLRGGHDHELGRGLPGRVTGTNRYSIVSPRLEQGRPVLCCPAAMRSE
jgi:hypothetical protein